MTTEVFLSFSSTHTAILDERKGAMPEPICFKFEKSSLTQGSPAGPAESGAEPAPGSAAEPPINYFQLALGQLSTGSSGTGAASAPAGGFGMPVENSGLWAWLTREDPPGHTGIFTLMQQKIIWAGILVAGLLSCYVPWVEAHGAVPVGYSFIFAPPAKYDNGRDPFPVRTSAPKIDVLRVVIPMVFVVLATIAAVLSVGRRGVLNGQISDPSASVP